MRYGIWVLVMLLSVTRPGQAGQDTTAPVSTNALRRIAAEKLLDLFNMDQTYDQAMQQTMDMAVGMIDQQDLPAQEKAYAQKALQASIAVSMKKFSWTHMKGIFVDIYAGVLDLEELEGLIAFYESPIGQRFLKKQPQLSLATMQKMQMLMQEMMPELQEAVDEAIQVEAVIDVYTE